MEEIIAREEREDREAQRCLVCGAAMQEIHCKIICPRCGFTRDCSDP